MSSILSILRATFGDRVGVVEWIGGGEEIIFRVAGLSRAEERLIDTVSRPSPIPIRAKDASVALSTLDTLRERIQGRVESELDWPDGFLLGINLETVTVLAGVPFGYSYGDDPEMDRALDIAIEEAEALGGAPAIETEGGQAVFADAPGVQPLLSIVELSTSDVAVDLREGLPTRSGKWIGVDGGVPQECTVGWVMVSPYAKQYAATAAHCSKRTNATYDPMLDARVYSLIRSDGSDSMDKTQYHGKVNQAHWTKRWDVASFSLAGSPDTNARVLVGTNSYRVVTGTFREIDQTFGTEVCGTGGWMYSDDSNQAVRCGPLLLTDVGGSDGGDKNLNCYERRSDGGDSGGPVWRTRDDGSAAAAGVIVQNLSYKPSWTTTKHLTCYHTIDDVESRLGYKVMLNGGGTEK